LEVRSDLSDGRIGRVIFLRGAGTHRAVAQLRKVLLHSFAKKTHKTAAHDLKLALKRMKEVLRDDK